MKAKVNAEQMLGDARRRVATKLVDAQPPLSPELVYRLTWDESPEISTVLGPDIDGIIHYNPAFIESLTADQMAGLVLHELVHWAYALFKPVIPHMPWETQADTSLSTTDGRHCKINLADWDFDAGQRGGE